MKLELRRGPSTEKSTPGTLWIDTDPEPLCYTLEDVVREIPGVPVSEWKIPKQTAIPRGDYRVGITLSNRFKKRTPILYDVPGFTGIRIHSGNVAADTEGCILVGFKNGPDAVYESRVAYMALYARLEVALLAGDPVQMVVVG